MLSTDYDFAAFLESVRLEDVRWEGYATATYLERRLWTATEPGGWSARKVRS